MKKPIEIPDLEERSLALLTFLKINDPEQYEDLQSRLSDCDPECRVTMLIDWLCDYDDINLNEFKTSGIYSILLPYPIDDIKAKILNDATKAIKEIKIPTEKYKIIKEKMHSKKLSIADKTSKIAFKIDLDERINSIFTFLKVSDPEQYDDLRSRLPFWPAEHQTKMLTEWIQIHYEINPNNAKSLVVYSMLMPCHIDELRERMIDVPNTPEVDGILLSKKKYESIKQKLNSKGLSIDDETFEVIKKPIITADKPIEPPFSKRKHFKIIKMTRDGKQKLY